jgi:hypothetical protein
VGQIEKRTERAFSLSQTEPPHDRGRSRHRRKFDPVTEALFDRRPCPDKNTPKVYPAAVNPARNLSKRMVFFGDKLIESLDMDSAIKEDFTR